MEKSRKKELQIIACKVRMGIIEGVFNAKSGHPGGSLSIADTLTYLYFEKMNVDPKDCMMIGNDVNEDMVASELGMDVFLVDTDLLNIKNKDINNILLLIYSPPIKT